MPVSRGDGSVGGASSAGSPPPQRPSEGTAWQDSALRSGLGRAGATRPIRPVGKKSLQWTRTPRGALAMMIELNNRCALDGRDQNSVSGIFWVLGRYDRPWAPRRDVFGVVRYMSSERTVRKRG